MLEWNHLSLSSSYGDILILLDIYFLYMLFGHSTTIGFHYFGTYTVTVLEKGTRMGFFI